MQAARKEKQDETRRRAPDDGATRPADGSSLRTGIGWTFSFLSAAPSFFSSSTSAFFTVFTLRRCVPLPAGWELRGGGCRAGALGCQ